MQQMQSRDLWPLISLKKLTEFSPEDYRAYIDGIFKPYKVPKAKPISKPVSVTKNKKGSIVFRIKRKPKVLFEHELEDLAKAVGMKLAEFRLLCADRKIEITKAETLLEAIPWS